VRDSLGQLMAAEPSRARIGTLAIHVDGEWDMEDLRNVSQGLAETYGLFYPLVAQDEVVRERLQSSLQDTFWSGNTESRRIGERLYRQVPFAENLKLKSFYYSSPGTMTVVGVLSVLFLMAKVTNAWIKAADGFLDLWKKIDKFFEHRKHLQRPERKFELDNEMATDSDAARSLVFDVGVPLGFNREACEALISVHGNPISALKYLVAVAKEGRKLATLQNEGKLSLPVPPDPNVQIELSSGARIRRSGGLVVTKKPRKP
jgi:hypothetical protein